MSNIGFTDVAWSRLGSALRSCATGEAMAAIGCGRGSGAELPQARTNCTGTAGPGRCVCAGKWLSACRPFSVSFIDIAYLNELLKSLSLEISEESEDTRCPALAKTSHFLIVNPTAVCEVHEAASRVRCSMFFSCGLLFWKLCYALVWKDLKGQNKIRLKYIWNQSAGCICSTAWTWLRVLIRFSVILLL